MKRLVKRLRDQQRRWWPTPSIVLAGAALFVALGGSAVAANGLIQAGDIAPGAVTSRAIKDGGIKPQDLSSTTRSLLVPQEVQPAPRVKAAPPGARAPTAQGVKPARPETRATAPTAQWR